VNQSQTKIKQTLGTILLNRPTKKKKENCVIRLWNGQICNKPFLAFVYFIYFYQTDLFYYLYYLLLLIFILLTYHFIKCYLFI